MAVRKINALKHWTCNTMHKSYSIHHICNGIIHFLYITGGKALKKFYLEKNKFTKFQFISVVRRWGVLQRRMWKAGREKPPRGEKRSTGKGQCTSASVCVCLRRTKRGMAEGMYLQEALQVMFVCVFVELTRSQTGFRKWERKKN